MRTTSEEQRQECGRPRPGSWESLSALGRHWAFERISLRVTHRAVLTHVHEPRELDERDAPSLRRPSLLRRAPLKGGREQVRRGAVAQLGAERAAQPDELARTDGRSQRLGALRSGYLRLHTDGQMHGRFACRCTASSKCSK
eukprot:6212967-Pleurochrysis_carterae.AAC.3